MKWDVKNSILLLCFIHSASWAMNEESQPHIFTQLPINIQNKIAILILQNKYDYYFDQLDNQTQKIEDIEDQTATINNTTKTLKLTQQRSTYQQIGLQSENTYTLFDDTNKIAHHHLIPTNIPSCSIETDNEEKTLEMLNQGYNYDGIFSEKKFELSKNITLQIHKDVVIVHNHHQIFYFPAGDTQAQCLYNHPLQDSIDNLITISQFHWPDTFDYIQYNPQLQSIAIRYTQKTNTQSKVKTIPIPPINEHPAQTIFRSLAISNTLGISSEK